MKEIAPDPNKSNSTHVQSVERTLRILEAFADCREPLTLGEIARLCDLKPSTAHRLLATLVTENFACQDVLTGKYRLGLKAFQVGSAAFYAADLRRVALPQMTMLVDNCQETANLAVMEHTNRGYELVYIDQVESPRMIRTYARIGSSMPLHCTGSGKVLLAYCEQREFEVVLRSLVTKQFTEKTIIDRERLLEQLRLVRTSGYAIDLEETETGVVCVAAPIKNHENRVIAAVSVSGPLSRMTPPYDYIISQVVETGMNISRAMGYNQD
jgi:DNA-binding IclR family transcriptional regulator